MKILNKFIWSKKEPSNKNDIWFDGSTWKMYTEEAWQSFTLPVDAADKVAKVIENVSEVYQEKLNAGYGIIIDGNTISLDKYLIDIELNKKQDELKSGENIKTINGQSILGDGDIEIKGGNSTYVTDFTVADLIEAINGTPKQCNLARLKQALENKEIILVPYGPEEYKGYSLLQGYSEDLLYFVVTDENGNIYSIETDTNASDITGDNITYVSPRKNEIDIIDLQKKDTQTETKLTELSAEIEEKSEVSLETLANGNLKVTIDGVSKDFMAATPSGDPMHYNYITVGALYNDTDSAIARTDYFGKAVSHLPGRWYVEGLGDLTNAEMREVYEAGKWWENTNDKGFASNIKARAILRCPAFQQVNYKAPFEFKQAFNGSDALEVVDLRPSPEIHPTTASFNRTKCSTMDFLCQNSPKVKYIYGIIDASAPVDGNSFWIHTPGLIEVRLYNIKREVKLPQSKAISKASILYMIENEAVTNSAVISLHANAYARLSADEDIVAALAAHPLVSLAKA